MDIISSTKESVRNFFNQVINMGNMDVYPEDKAIWGEKSRNGKLIFNSEIVKSPEDKVWFAIRYRGCASNIHIATITDLDINVINEAIKKLEDNGNIFSRYQYSYDEDNGDKKVVDMWMVKEENPPSRKISPLIPYM